VKDPAKDSRRAGTQNIRAAKTENPPRPRGIREKERGTRKRQEASGGKHSQDRSTESVWMRRKAEAETTDSETGAKPKCGREASRQSGDDPCGDGSEQRPKNRTGRARRRRVTRVGEVPRQRRPAKAGAAAPRSRRHTQNGPRRRFGR